MSNDRLTGILIWLLIIAASVFLFERALILLHLFAPLMLLFGFAWLIALILRPPVDWLTGLSLPILVPMQHLQPNKLDNSHIANIWQLPRSMSVFLVYLAFLALVVIPVTMMVQQIGPQLVALQAALLDVDMLVTVRASVASIEEGLRRIGLDADLTTVVPPEMVSGWVATFVQEVPNIAGGVASLVGSTLINIILMVILSFYISLDGPRLLERLLVVIPKGWHTDIRTLLDIVDRVFGGFVRAQFVMVLIYSIATSALMLICDLNYVALSSLIAGLMVLIPIIGGVFAMIPPLVVALIESPDRFFILFIGLIVLQMILFNVIMPRLMGDSVGLHPLFVFAALLVGATIAGAWGILFGVPIAGVIAAVAQFIYLRATTSNPSEPPMNMNTPSMSMDVPIGASVEQTEKPVN